MNTEEQDDVQQRDTGASDVAPVDESRGKEPNEPVRVSNVRKENDDLTGRAYEYFHKLQ